MYTLDRVLEEVAMREAELDFEHSLDLFDTVSFYGTRVA